MKMEITGWEKKLENLISAIYKNSAYLLVSGTKLIFRWTNSSLFKEGFGTSFEGGNFIKYCESINKFSVKCFIHFKVFESLLNDM